jgi:hypothetical protein
MKLSRVFNLSCFALLPFWYPTPSKPNNKKTNGVDFNTRPTNSAPNNYASNPVWRAYISFVLSNRKTDEGSSVTLVRSSNFWIPACTGRKNS